MGILDEGVLRVGGGVGRDVVTLIVFVGWVRVRGVIYILLRG